MNNVIRFPVERTRPERLLTLHELSEALSFSERWVRYRISEGMPVRRYGKRLRFSLRDVNEWMEERDGAA